MQAGTLRRCGLALGLALIALAARAAGPLPPRNMLIEVRVVLEDAAASASAADRSPTPSGYTVGTQRAQTEMPPLQQVRVLNGDWAELRFAHALPLQWVQAAARGAPAASAGGAAAGQRSGAVVNAVRWLEAGQAMAVQATWPGGEQPATVAIAYAVAAVEDSAAGPLPATRRQRASTRLRVPLGRWTTFAALGAAPDAAPPGTTWSTQPGAARGRQLLQVQVQVLPP